MQDAENLLQDSFIKIWKNIHTYDPRKGRLFTWLITICRNTALNFLRSAENVSKTEIREDESGVYTQMLVTEPENMDLIGMSSQIDKLETNQRAVLNLIYIWGYTQQETAEKLEIPLGTVKTRVRLALRNLRKKLLN